jgi:outer membrane murein-binding lipoprotein Lpp
MSTVMAPALRPSPRPTPRHDPRRAPRPDPRPTPTDRRQHLRVVRPDERPARRLTPKVGVALTAVVFAILFAVAGAHTIIAQSQIRLDGLDTQVQTEQSRYQQLRKDVAQMESPERVVAAAEAQGMVTPQDLVYLQPPAAAGTSSIAASDTGTGTDTLASRPTAAPWSTVKPLLEAPAP